MVVGIHGPEGHTRINPSSTASLSSLTLKEGDILIALGNEAQVQLLKEFTDKTKGLVKRRLRKIL
jgi:uncharacterized protein with PhoU and TrkA domain